jgi:hypothetical protein
MTVSAIIRANEKMYYRLQAGFLDLRYSVEDSCSAACLLFCVVSMLFDFRLFIR